MINQLENEKCAFDSGLVKIDEIGEEMTGNWNQNADFNYAGISTLNILKEGDNFINQLVQLENKNENVEKFCMKIFSGLCDMSARFS